MFAGSRRDPPAQRLERPIMQPSAKDGSLAMRRRYEGMGLVWVLTASVSMLSACSGGDDGGGTGVSTGGDDLPATMTAPGTGPGDDGATGMVDDDGGTTVGTATTPPGTGSDGPPGCAQEPQENGASCADPCECVSESCYFVSLIGGSCGECTSDADCPDGGCSIPNPLADPPQGATCNMGEAGAGCETNDVCQEGLVCGTLLDVPGVLTLATCGECLTDADCTDQLCSPTLDVANFSGQRLCVDPGTVENGQACDHLASGNEACASGICATVDIMGVVTVGVCGDCTVDADCDMGAGEVCMAADINQDTFEVIPPTCAVP